MIKIIFNAAHMKTTNNMVKSYLTILMVFAAIFILEGCSSQKSTIYWVNSVKNNCTNGAGQTKCLMIHKGDSIDTPQWELFYAEIEGFTWEPGYFQKIELKEEILDKENLPADASGIKYSLINVLEKQKDSRFDLNAKWILYSIHGNLISPGNPLPTIEFKLSEMRVFGNNGCNNYSGSIENITSDTITFGPVMSTKMMCMEMAVPDTFDQALFKSLNYKVDNQFLKFTDGNGNETLSFKKEDL